LGSLTKLIILPFINSNKLSISQRFWVSIRINLIVFPDVQMYLITSMEKTKILETNSLHSYFSTGAFSWWITFTSNTTDFCSAFFCYPLLEWCRLVDLIQFYIHGNGNGYV